MTDTLRPNFRCYLRPLLLLPALSLGLGFQLAAAPLAASVARSVRADITITGRVVDEKGAGLPGVNVIVKGTSNGTQTDVEGRYSIKAADTATLVFTFVGYTAQEEADAGRTVINAALAPDAKGLEEMMVVGYGVQEKKMLATGIATISAKQVELIPVASPSEALVGLVAGAQITEPSGEPGQGAVIRVRGLGSISAGNNPLYVVDGYPLNNPDSYNQIPPGDIQSVQILKDAAACAIYGSRGGNGIVIVTTKRGTTDGKTRFNFSANTGFQQVAKRMDLLNRDQFLEYYKELYTNAGRAFTPAMTALFAQDQNALPDTDWQKEIFQTGLQQQYQLSASSGTAAARFYVSGGYFKQSGVVRGSGFERFSLRANYDAQLSKRLKLGLSSLAPNFTRTDVVPISGSYNGGNISGGGPGGETGAVTAALIMAPIVPVRLANGDYAGLKTGTKQAIVFLTTNEMNTEILAAARYTKGGLGVGSYFSTWFMPELPAAVALTVNGNVGVGQQFNSVDPDLMAAFTASGVSDVRAAASFGASGTGTAALYYTKKYNDVPTTAFDAENDWIILRYADVLLLYAEAVNEAGGPNTLALDAVNRVIRRSRGLPVATPAPAVDLPATIGPADLRTRLELERRLELNFEGHRWFDLVRTDRAIPVMNAYFTQYSIRANGATTGPVVQIDQHNLLFPLPIQELQTNPILTQNLGYN